MLNIKTALLRITDNWRIILGEPLYKAILADVDVPSTMVLADSAVEMYGPELLRDESKRRAIFQVLFSDEIDELIASLDVEIQRTKSYTLSHLKIRKNSSLEKKLFDFFGLEVPIKDTTKEVPDFEEVTPEYGLYSYQRNVAIKAVKKLDVPGSRFMIHMPTGSGKTRVAMRIVSTLLNKQDTTIIWLAYSEELCEQAISEFQRVWKKIGDRTVSVSRIYSYHKFHDISDGLIVAGLPKLWKHSQANVRFLDEIAKKCSLVIFDEAHQSVASTYMSMLRSLQVYNKKISFVGLSATPGRSTYQETESLSEFFDRDKITLEIEGYDSPINFLYEEGYLAKPCFTRIMSKASLHIRETEDDYDSKALTKIGFNAERNEIVLQATKKAISEGHKRILLFAASVESAQLFTYRLKRDGVKAHLITGDTDSAVRASKIDDFKTRSDDAMVLCNFGVLTTGFDVPEITAVVIARPTTSLNLYSQMVGRALRGPRMGGTETAKIVTIVDTDLPGYGSVVEAFESWDEQWTK